MATESRNISETPENWIVVQIPDGYKIFASWFGGYLDGDRWKINSGITKVEQDEDYYYFYGYSGSCYKCHKSGYGTGTSWTGSVLEDYIKKSGGLMVKLEDREDWTTLEI